MSCTCSNFVDHIECIMYNQWLTICLSKNTFSNIGNSRNLRLQSQVCGRSPGRRDGQTRVERGGIRMDEEQIRHLINFQDEAQERVQAII